MRPAPLASIVRRLRARATRDGRAEGDRGAVLAEFAITLPILVALIFGIIDFGSTLNDYQAVREGARDGLRWAIVQKTDPGAPTCTPVGPTPSNGAAAIVCYTKSRVNLDNSKTRVKVKFCDTTGTGCASVGTPPYKSLTPLKICVQYQTSSISGLFSSILDDKVLSTEVETLIESDWAASTIPSSYAETPLTSWPASCDSL